MKQTSALLVFLLAVWMQSIAQTIPSDRVTDWSKAGHTDTLPVFSTTINIMNHGAVADGTTANDTAFANALSALNGQPGTIYFPAGNYLFKKPINIYRDSIVLKGEGASSKLAFDIGGPVDMINIIGSIDNTTYNTTTTVNKGDNTVKVNNGGDFSVGSYVFITDNDKILTTSAWAAGSTGQVLKIISISGNDLTVENKLRRNYTLNNTPVLKKLTLVKDVGIECMYIERKDATTDQTNNITFDKTVDCWVTGIESYNSNFAHVAVRHSTHALLRGNYMHHAHAYGGNGKAYGTLVEYGSGECLIENNIFEHLRHSMLVQSGANGNVFAYNYSFDPYWDEPPFPTNSAGDIVCHGNYPYLNLFEGNIIQSIVIDDSHGINGPFNTFFRNRAQLYGIFTNANPASDSMNYVGNEITSTLPGLAYYLLNGKGHFEYGNNVKSVIAPVGTNTISEKSLYLQAEPGYWLAHNTFPSIGAPHDYNTGRNSAIDRHDNNLPTDCTKNPVYTSIKSVSQEDMGILVSPNPFNNLVHISASISSAFTYRIYNTTGQILKEGSITTGNSTIETAELSSGLYILKVRNTQGTCAVFKLLKK
ncbi:MAG: T9SS type A sorting domain-containing protein [Chitinophagaceae bacterium]|nr:T9SS type A sorting domain-containing protein [Chitinophagaceae bacterium]